MLPQMLVRRVEMLVCAERAPHNGEEGRLPRAIPPEIPHTENALCQPAGETYQ